MEDLIMKIIDIEDRAQEVIKDAKKADRELEERIKDESRKMRDDITRRMEAKNVTLKQIEEEDADKKVEAIRVNMERHLSELEKKYNDNKDKWVNEIVQNIYTHEERSNDEVNQSKFDAFFETHTKINREIMHNAKSLSDCIEACKNTPYSEPLQRAENIGADSFSMGMVLDTYYYKSIWHTASVALDKTQVDGRGNQTACKCRFC